MPSSLADLRRAYFNGGTDAELAFYQSFYNEGLTADDVLNVVRAGSDGDYESYLDAPVDGTTNSAPFINALVNDSGRYRQKKGILFSQAPLVIPKNTLLEGWGSTVSANSSGSGGVTFGIVFDPASIMAGGNAATVTADGTWWKFSLLAGPHGLSAGNSFTASGCVAGGFNIVCLIDHVIGNDLYVANATIPSAADAGFVNVHLVRLGSMTGFAPNCGLKHMWVECRSIPGSMGVYSNSIQENGGLEYVTVHNAMYRGVSIDASDPLGNGITALNYLIRNLRTIGSDNALSTYRGLKIKQGNTSSRGVDGVTCVGGGAGANLPAAQIQIEGAYSGAYRGLHVENAVDGVVIGDEQACHAIEVDATGNASITGSTVRVSSATTQRRVRVRAMQNGSVAGALNDQLAGVIFPGEIGPITCPITTDGTVTANLNGSTDKNIVAGSNNDLVSVSLQVGVWDITGAGLIVPGVGTTSVEMRLVAGTATATATGIRSAQFDINGVQPDSALVRARFIVTVAGTVLLRFFAAGANATAKASTTVNAAPDATGIFATRVA